jgi:hypothetical protein
MNREEKIKELISQMTLEEKVSQLSYTKAPPWNSSFPPRPLKQSTRRETLC